MTKNIVLFIAFYLMSSFYQKEKKEEIIVFYSAISCSCAQWQIVNSKSKEHIYLERSDKNSIDANKMWDGETLPLQIKITGHFKKETGLPAGMKFKGNPEPARVFKYDKITIIKYKKL